MANIYIAREHSGDPLALILAPDMKTAEIVFSSMNLAYNSVEEIDPSTNPGINGVCYVLTSTTHNSMDYSHRPGGIDFRYWKRGL